MPSPILQLPLVTPNQNQKETTINTALAILEAASNDARGIDATANTNLILSQDNFTRYLMQRVQNNTADITVRVPALKRFFVVAAEGTGSVTFWPQGGVPTTNGAEVAAGTISLLMSDGVNIRAISSGVTRLQDLTDVITTPVMDGQVLAYILAEDKWRPATIAEVLNVAFIGLTDTPSSYTGQGGAIPRVKTAEDGIEFVDPATIVGAQSFLDLNDTPDSYLGAAQMLIAVKADMTGFEFVAPTAQSFTGLTDAPASYEGQAGKVPVVDDEESGLVFRDLGEATGQGIDLHNDTTEVKTNVTDVIFSGPGVTVEDTGVAGEARVAIEPDFTDLGDTPDNYEGQGGKAVMVKADESGLEYGDAGASAFTELSDTPSAYTGQKKKLVAVKTGEDGLEYVDNQNASIITAKTGAYTAVLDDAYAVIPFDTAADVVFTLPPASSAALPINTQITVLQIGSGKVLVSAGAGVTIRVPAGLLARTRTQWSAVMAMKIASNTWVLLGDMEAEA